MIPVATKTVNGTCVCAAYSMVIMTSCSTGLLTRLLRTTSRIASSLLEQLSCCLLERNSQHRHQRLDVLILETGDFKMLSRDSIGATQKLIDHYFAVAETPSPINCTRLR